MFSSQTFALKKAHKIFPLLLPANVFVSVFFFEGGENVLGDMSNGELDFKILKYFNRPGRAAFWG